METKQLSSLSICGQLTINMHSLNNEGGEGNQILTRQVTIVDKEGNFKTVNAVSGDMLKHIQAEHFWNIAVENGLSLSSACRKFDANRITADDEFIKSFKKETPDADVLDLVIKKSSLSEVEGILITNNNKNVPRKSCAEFGWLIGLPDKTKTENYFHVKLVADSGSKESGEGANLGQNIFHRPANSGVYALVSNFDICRVGYNDISKKYAIDDKERNNRVTALLKSILYTFIKPTGAMRNTQNPHIVDFNGVITLSSKAIPAPTTSPINDKYVEEIASIAVTLNKIEKESIAFIPFDSLSKFVEEFEKIIANATGYKLKEA
ncbi:MAG: DevR family CRISPR-associated autoregulator [Ignavibacteriales bacterium]|nr:DevR family CRISPR-associated autoregulator [Ignavibacteriales bacterium]